MRECTITPEEFAALGPDGVAEKLKAAGYEGAIQFAIGEKDGKVVIDFGTPVHWLGLTPQQAADFASLLLKRARAVGRKNGESIGFTIG